MTPAADPRLEALRKRVAQAPTEPGIYRWLNDSGTVMYVGKAKNLRNRLRSYVQKGTANAGPWKQSFQQQIADFDVTVTSSELEALLLETNLIKQLRPKYNVLMKDDKNYLFIRVTVKDPYPRVETIRRPDSEDGSKHFGPYLSGYEVRETLDMLHLALGYRACKESIQAFNRDPATALGKIRPCLDYQIGRCNGLCAGMISREEYRRRIDRVVEFLKGNTQFVHETLKSKMQEAARERKFETAAKLRNHILRLEGKPEQQIVTDASGEDCDVFGVAILSNRAHVVVLHRRAGRLIGESHFSLAGQAESIASVLEQFLPQYYDEGEVPDDILIPEKIEDQDVMQQHLRTVGKRAVRLIVPERGRKSRLLQLAERNARQKAKQLESKWEAEEKNVSSALEELQAVLQLPAKPKRIEGYDISHLGGTETVGSMVVMKDGKSANDQYRSFTIRTLKSGEVDDYQAIKEVLTRRLRRLTEDLKTEEKKWNENGITFGKGLKKDQSEIERIHETNTDEMENLDIKYSDYIVARHKNSIVGFGRLFKHPKNIVELKSIWVEEPLRGQKLGQFIARKLLRSVKKGKVYVTVNPQLESYYTYLGFRYVHSGPAVFEERLDRYAQSGNERGIIMMWEAHQNKIDPSLTAMPDLIVIDGGKGQLSTAVDVLKRAGLEIPVIGLAKREEEVFVPGRSDPIPFRPESPGKFLLMRLRDEAHRFSNRHREARQKTASKASRLDEIPGIGDESRTQLLKKFGSLSAIAAAPDAELQDILSFSQIAALREHL